MIIIDILFFLDAFVKTQNNKTAVGNSKPLYNQNDLESYMATILTVKEAASSVPIFSFVSINIVYVDNFII